MTENLYKLAVTEIASGAYLIAAESPEAAREKLKNGKWDHFTDLGHDDPVVHDIELVRVG